MHPSRGRNENGNWGEETSRRSVLRAGLSVAGVAGGALSLGTGSVAAASKPEPRRYTYDILGGTDHKTTVHVYESGVAGPTTLVVGGIHGDEEASYRAAGDVTNWRVRTGNLVVLPRANTKAIRRGVRPYDSDLNRDFPATADQCSTNVARKIWRVAAIWQPDLVFSLHTAPGIYRSPAGGTGQSIFPTGFDSAPRRGARTVEALNQKFGLKNEFAFRRGPTIDPYRSLFVHRVTGTLRTAGYTCTTTENVSVKRQRRWLRFCIKRTMEQFGQKRGKPITDGKPPGPDKPRMISIVGTGTPINYELSVSDALYGTDNVEETIDGRTVHGYLKWYSDNYWFRGKITSLTVSGNNDDVKIWIEGKRYSPSDF